VASLQPFAILCLENKLAEPEVVEEIMTKLLLVLATALFITAGSTWEASAVTTAECQLRYGVCDKSCKDVSCRRVCKQNLRTCLYQAHQG